jgi:sugar phosphate isomerase/epimerase
MLAINLLASDFHLQWLGAAYPLTIDSAKFNETQARLKARNVRVLDIEVIRIDAETNVSDFASVIEVGAKLGASRICVNGEDPDLARFTESWANLCNIAQQFDMQVDLEFMVWRPIRTLQIAAKVVADANCSNGKVLVDALHLFRSGGTVSDVQSMDPKLLGSLQLCDGPIKGPDTSDTNAILAEARAGRLPPLEGEFPLVELIRAMPASTPISVEVPMPPSEKFPDSISRVRHIREATARCLDLANQT